MNFQYLLDCIDKEIQHHKDIKDFATNETSRLTSSITINTLYWIRELIENDKLTSKKLKGETNAETGN